MNRGPSNGILPAAGRAGPAAEIESPAMNYSLSCRLRVAVRENRTEGALHFRPAWLASDGGKRETPGR